MSNEIVDKLLNSLNVLESAITGAQSALSKRASISPDVMQRIESYSSILTKQREIANNLSVSVESSDWVTVAQQVHVINRLLDMIREDASEILSELQGINTQNEEENDEPKFLIC